MAYTRQVIIKIKCSDGYEIITNGAATLNTKADTQKDCKTVEVEIDPNIRGLTGRVTLPDNWQTAVDFLKTADDEHNRIYILTHGSSVSPGNLQGMNASEVAYLLLPFKGRVKKITLVVCKGGNTAAGGVNFAEQLATALVGFNATVCAYKAPVAIYTPALVEKYRSPQSLGKKFVSTGDKPEWVRDYSTGVEKVSDSKVSYPTKSA